MKKKEKSKIISTTNTDESRLFKKSKDKMITTADLDKDGKLIKKGDEDAH